MKSCVFTRSRDEFNLIEWMVYYYDMGFDSIIIYDDNSDDFGTIQEFIDKNCKNLFDNTKYEIIKKFQFNNGKSKLENLNSSNEFYKPIIDKIKSLNMDYVLHVDLDEYLVLNNFQNIRELISFYSPFDELQINWLIYGNSKIKTSLNNHTMLDRFKYSADKLNPHVKSLTKVNSIISNDGPHTMRFLKPNSIYKNIYNIEYKGFPNEFLKKVDISENPPIFIAHFITNDTNSWFKRRYYGKHGSRTHEINKLCKDDIVKYNFNMDAFLITYSNNIVDLLYSENIDNINNFIEKLDNDFYKTKNLNDFQGTKMLIKKIILEIHRFYKNCNQNTISNSFGNFFIQKYKNILY